MSQQVDELYELDNEFRDKLATVDTQGKRVWVYPKKPKGHYHNLRIGFTIILLGLLFAGPLIKVDGHPFLLFNFIERKFIIFGVAFWPQDFHLFLLGMITFFVFIILFTVVFGRLWCGWACPQTVFMEMVFRKIEYWIEGDAIQQRKLDKQSWNNQKIFKKGLKHFIFLLIAILIAHTLMAYLVGFDQVKQLVTSSPSEHMGGFIALVLFTGIFYWVFAFFREQACVAVCPYGRLQGVLLGPKSIVVAYDWVRGEPRGKLRKGKVQEGNGDCISCKRCVHVCPTGIDIRNGTQLECVNCTACMDACDDVMTTIKRPKGLIRYDSHENIKEGKKNLFNSRAIGYTALLSLLIGVLVYLLATRVDVEATVLRVPGMLYQEQPGNKVSNLYNIKFINKTFEEINLDLKIKDEPGAEIRRVGEEALVVPASSSEEGVYFIELPRTSITAPKTQLTVQLLNNGEIVDEIKTNFLGPTN
ncbi:MAG: cytochrome c oxidase accessory protein CcoG [Candidatus Cyclobacteriaceae bacterium M3_2C_046]